MSDQTFNQFVASGATAERLAFVPDPPSPASGPDPGYVWWDTDLQTEFAYDFGLADWVATGGGGSGTVTNTGTLTDHALIVGNGGVDVSALASLGTTTTVLHGNAAGDPSFGAVNLAADVSGDLPFANLAQASAASRLLGRGSASGAGDFEEITVGSNLTFSATALNVTTATKTRAITLAIDGGGSAISTGIKADIYVPYACTITAVTMLADQSGSIVVDIWKDAYANYPPTIADTITASAKPTISSATKSTDSTLTGWTTSISAGDTLRFNVDSAATVTRLHLALTVTV